ncbi:MAG: hypothetical protein J5493_04775 [Lachnospiraceae bacterium]|nr:hypothetical protein [Lachnospiraceae bacterium]
MKRRAFWKAFFLCFALTLGLLVFGSPGKVQAEESNGPVYYVYINGYYLGEGEGTYGLYYVGTSDTTGYVTTDSSSDWNARYIPSSGRLILRNYRGGKIVCLTNNNKANFDVELHGINFITETNDTIGMQVNPDDTNLLIFSDDYGSLMINVCSMDDECYGINNFTSGSAGEGVYVQGNASLTVLATGKSGIGIRAGGTVGILEQASADIEARYNKNANYSFSAAVYSKDGNLDVSTSGSVSIASTARDLHQHSGYGYAFYSGRNSGCLNCSPKNFPYVSLSAVGYHAKVSNRSTVLDSTYYNLEKTVKQTGVTEGLLLQYSTSDALPIVGAIFPDPSFRSYVRNKYDTNSDGKLSESERLYIKTITVEDDEDGRLYNDAYSLVGIENFTNLTQLTWDPDSNDLNSVRGNLLELDLRSNKELKRVTVRSTRLRELYVSYLSKLTWLDCTNNALHGPTLSGLTSLTDLLLYNNLLTNITVSVLPNLDYLDVGENLLQTLDVSWNTKLRFLYCQNNKLESLDITNLTELTDLTCGGNLFTTLNLTKNTALGWLSCNNSCLTTLNVSKNTALYALDCSCSDSLKALSLGNNSNLKRLRFFDSPNLTAVNISGCSQLKTVIASGSRKNVTEDGYTFRQYGIYDEAGYASRCIDADIGTILIYQKPTAVYTYTGTKKTFAVKAESGLGLTYRWQYRTSSSGSWKNCTSATEGYNTDTLKVKPEIFRSGYQYRCKITNTDGWYGYSPAATLYVIGINGQPSDVSTTAGKTASFKVTAVGGGLKYQWRWRKNGGEWADCTSATEGYNKATLKVNATEGRNGYQYQCKVTDANGNFLYTNVANLFVLKTQPASVSTTAGKTATFKAVGYGTGLKYQWQFRTSSSGTWKNCTSATTGYNTTTLKVAAATGRNGYQYRCEITNSAGLTVRSKIVTLNVLGIKTQPASVTTTKGKTVSFKVEAVGKGLTYQWQFRSSSSAEWTDCSSATEGYNKATLKVVAQAHRNGYQYRCVVKDSAGNSVNSKAATLTIN